MADPTINQLVLHHVAPVTFPEPRQQIKGVVFDMDGTLIHEAIDYAAMRAALGIEYPKDVIMEIRAMKDAVKQQELWDIIEQFESAARVTLKAHDGATELIAFLKLHQVRVGLFTRNSSHGILAMKQVTGLEFDYELSRDFHPPKPAPDGAMMMASAWDLKPSEILFVGDSQDDIGCGKAAGMKTVLFDPTGKRPHLHSVSNLVVTSLMEITQHLTNGVLL